MKLSIIVPVYNAEKYLDRTIKNILEQTFTDFEFLILNDSPDNKEIENIVKEYAKRDKRIKYYKNEKNMGITPSRNKLLDLAKGEYLAIFDHDDISVPERLEKEVAYLDSYPYCGVVSGWIQYFGDDEYVCKTKENDVDIKISLTDHCEIMHTAAMIRKSILDEYGVKYDEKYTPNEDHWLWICLIDLTYFHNIQDVLVKYRWHKNNTSHNQQIKMDAKFNIIRSYMTVKYPLLRKEYEKNYRIGTVFRLRLFGFIPLLKIKNNKIYIFEVFPVFKIKWR